MHLNFFCCHNKQFNVTCEGGHCLGTHRLVSVIQGWGTKVLDIIGHLMFKGWHPWDHPLSSWVHVITSSLTQGTRICMAYELEFNSFQDIGAPLVQGGRNYSVWSWLVYIQMLYDTIKEQEYIWFMGGNLKGFQYIWAPLASGVPDHSIWSWPTYHQMLLETRNKNTYGLGVGISMLFRY
jgi:hypothetical protein